MFFTFMKIIVSECGPTSGVSERFIVEDELDIPSVRNSDINDYYYYLRSSH